MSSKNTIIVSTTNFWLLSLLAAFLLLDPSAAYAYDTKIEEVLCNTLSLVQGPVGKAIGIIAIIVTGVSLFMGKVSWGLMISTAIGIGFVFGAAGIVDKLGGSGTGTLDCTASEAAPEVDANTGAS
jgi:type IV secretory pathway VirB2 component (pilin)